MKKWKKNSDRGCGHASLHRKLRYIILSLAVPLVFCIFLVLCVFIFYTEKYTHITHNVNVSSKFSLDFKDDIDLKMYYYCVGNREQTTLPVEEVHKAVRLARSLKETTYRKESRRAISNVINYCRNLEEKMYMVRDTDDYDSRQVQLENNIYVLTRLIQREIGDYIYYEVGYLSGLEENMVHNIMVMIIGMGLVMLLIVALVLRKAFWFSKGITGPILQLRENVRQIGHGHFDIVPVESDDYEIADLDAGIRRMAGRIRRQMAHIKKEEKLHHKMELQLLQAQINPHFLYNTLDTIVWLVECSMNDEAVKMLGDLSVFFRTMLSKGEDIVTLREEFMHVKSYLEIQQVRYRDIMDFTVELPDTLADLRLPKLTVQPLAENALYHGVKEKRGKSTIRIYCEAAGENVRIIVEDNGIGMKPERLDELRRALEKKERVGFGTSAVAERLRIYFGDGYGLTFFSEYGTGTRVTAVIPREMKGREEDI